MRREVQVKGKSGFVAVNGQTYRFALADFQSGKRTYRNGWCIEPWSDRAKKTTEAEANWQD